MKIFAVLHASLMLFFKLFELVSFSPGKAIALCEVDSDHSETIVKIWQSLLIEIPNTPFQYQVFVERGQMKPGDCRDGERVKFADELHRV